MAYLLKDSVLLFYFIFGKCVLLSPCSISSGEELVTGL
jgi:hypothetical protein